VTHSDPPEPTPRPAKSLQERRAEAVDLRAAGVPVMQVVAQTGLSWSAVSSALKLHAAGGSDALVPRPRGRKPGQGQKLDDDQARQVRDLMRLRRPYYYRLKSALWTRDLLLQLIDQKLGVTMTDRALGNYLVEWGIEVGSRHEQPRDRCSPSVRRWLDVNHPTVIQYAKEANAAIYWMNRAKQLPAALWTPVRAVEGVGGAAQVVEIDAESDEDVHDNGYGDTDRGPAAPSLSGRIVTYRLASAINNQGKLFWAVINSAFTSKQRKKFTEALVKDTRKTKLIVINQEGAVGVDGEPHIWRPDTEKTVLIVP